MKKIITLLFACAIFVSCGKTKRCWECTTTVDYSPNAGQSEKSSHEFCNKTKSDIKKYEDIFTYDDSTMINGKQYKAIHKCTCKAKL